MTKTSLYRFYSEADQLLYVGIARNPFQRLSGHFVEKSMTEVRCLEIEWFESRSEALDAESWAIRREKPLWNISAPRKPRQVRKTLRPEIQKRAVDFVVPPPTEPKCLPKMGPHLPPHYGPPAPWIWYGIGAVGNASVDHHFDGEEASFFARLCRRGDVLVIGDDVAFPQDIVQELRESDTYVRFLNDL